MKLKLLILNFVFFLFSTKTALGAVAKVPLNDKGFADLSSLTIVFANIVSVVSTFAGFALLLMFIRGGLAYITAQGDPKAVAAARSSLTWAIIGFIVILAAYLIISLIVGFFAVPGIGEFCLPRAGSDAFTQCPLIVK